MKCWNLPLYQTCKFLPIEDLKVNVTLGLKSIEREYVWGSDLELDGRGLKVPYLKKVQRSKIFKGTRQTRGIIEKIEEVSAEMQCKLDLADHNIGMKV